jgi:hypothetical protein
VTPSVASKYIVMTVFEYAYTGGPIAYDVGGSVQQGSTKNPPGVTLSVTGNDLVIQIAYPKSGTISAITGSYTTPFQTPNGTGFAGWINTPYANNVANYPNAVPTWTNSSNVAYAISSLSFRESVHVIQFAANYALPTQSYALSVSSTGTCNLLVLGAYTAAPGTGVNSVTDGTNNFIHAIGTESSASTPGFYNDFWYLPCSTSGKTTITITGNASGSQVGGFFWEVAGLSNPVVDFQGAIQNAVQSGGVATGAPAVTTSIAEFIAATDQTSFHANGPSTGNAFLSLGGGDGVGNAGIALIPPGAGTYTPAFADTGSTFATSTIAFKSRLWIKHRVSSY